MANCHKIIFVAILVNILWCYGEIFHPESDESDAPDSSDSVKVSHTHESFPKSQLLEVVKSAILRHLNLTEPPTVTGPRPRLSRDVMRLVSGRKKDPEDPAETKSIVRPRNRAFSCFGSNRWDCSRFEFELQPDLDSVQSVQIWFHKRRPAMQLYVSVHFNSSSIFEEYDEWTSDVKSELNWIGFNLRKSALEDVGDVLRCTVEVSGGSVHETGEERPFLLVFRSSSTPGRHRRDAVVPESDNCTCCAVNRTISLTELTWDNWILAPQNMNVRACRGTCHYHQSTFNMSYGSLMYSLLKTNSAYANTVDEFWVPHCFPKKMESIKILYVRNNTKEIIESDVKDIVVNSCACMATTCHMH